VRAFNLTEAEEQLCAHLRGERPSTRPEASRALLEAAIAHRLDLVFADRIAREIGTPAFGELFAGAREAALLEELRRRELARVLTALHAAGVPAVVFKGGALAYQIYARPEWRPRADTDLLLEREDLPRARAALIACGYEQPTEVSGSLVTTQCHFARSDRTGVRHALDVHWKLFIAPRFADLFSVREIAASAVSLPELGPHARAMSRPHALIVCAVHRVAHHGDAGDLLWIWDIHRLASTLSVETLRAALSLAEQRCVAAVCARALHLAERCFGTGLPADVHEWCERENAHARREGLESYCSGERRLADRLWRDVRALSSWRDRARLLGQHCFPAPAYMRARYDANGRTWLPVLYARRLTMGIPKWLRRS
jgi:hypothetical protein